MTTTETRPVAPPFEVSSFAANRWADQIFKTALEINLFKALASKSQTAPEIAQTLKTDERGTAVLLDALMVLNLTKKANGRYELTEAAATYLNPDSDLYMGDFILGWEEMGHNWAELTEVIKTGVSQATVNRSAEAEKFFPRLAAAIFPLNYATAQATAEKLAVEKLPKDAKVLDLASGSGVWSIPMAQRNPEIQVDALDFPATLEVTRKFADKYHLSNQYGYLAGSWQDVSLRENYYDIAVLGHICHSEGWAETEKLFKKMYEVIKPGGRICVAEFLTNEAKTGPFFPMIFAVNMFVKTDKGCVFSDVELAQLLKNAGFTNPERLHLPYYGSESPVMVAHKPN